MCGLYHEGYAPDVGLIKDEDFVLTKIEKPKLGDDREHRWRWSSANSHLGNVGSSLARPDRKCQVRFT
jgi:hypothetical protein